MSDAEYESRLANTGRNETCPCGSKQKYKKCHLAEDQTKRSAALSVLQEEAKAKAALEAEEADSAEGGSDKAVATGKTKQAGTRQTRGRGATNNKATAAGGKPKNMPRRTAV